MVVSHRRADFSVQSHCGGWHDDWESKDRSDRRLIYLNAGFLTAIDTRTGKLAWVFHVIPHEDEFGYETWPKDAWKTMGGGHNWNEMTVDEKRGIAYIPLGSPRFDFHGASRHGQSLFGNSLLALDAHTGRRLWHFQMVHRDLWDYDLPIAPKPVEERPVPKSDVAAEESWPAQPFPAKPPPFARQSFTEKDVNSYVTEARHDVYRFE